MISCGKLFARISAAHGGGRLVKRPFKISAHRKSVPKAMEAEYGKILLNKKTRSTWLNAFFVWTETGIRSEDCMPSPLPIAILEQTAAVLDKSSSSWTRGGGKTLLSAVSFRSGQLSTNGKKTTCLGLAGPRKSRFASFFIRAAAPESGRVAFKPLNSGVKRSESCCFGCAAAEKFS